VTPLDDAEFRRWQDAAARALAAAGVQRDAGYHEWACFLCEQGAQLAVKGLLHGLGLGAWGHDLGALVARVPSELEGWPQGHARAAERLARFYIPTRYPDAVPGAIPGLRFDAEDSASALADAGAILDAVEDGWRQLRAAP
jgi:HEPN domain-containing protein